MKAIVFDFDGVILESHMIKRNSFACLFPEEYRSRINELLISKDYPPRKDAFRIILEAFPELIKENKEAEILAYIDMFEDITYDLVLLSKPVLGAIETLRKLKGKYLLFVATATPDEPIIKLMQKRDLMQYFIAVYGSTTGSKSDIVHLVCEKHSLKPNEIVFVGDSNRDLFAAKNTGTHFVGIRRPQNSFEQDPSLIVVDNLTTFTSIVERLEKSTH